jgi:hypothetical protein
MRENMELFKRLLTNADQEYEFRIHKEFGEFLYPKTMRCMFDWLESEPFGSECNLPVEITPVIHFLIENDVKFRKFFSATASVIACRQDVIDSEFAEIRREIAEKRDHRGGMGLTHDFKAMEKNARERKE